MSKNNLFPFKYRQLKTKIFFYSPIIGLGTQDKSRLCLAKSKDIYISDALGNLTNPEELGDFEKRLKSFVSFANVRDFAFDLHPNYISTQLAFNFLKTKKNNFKFFGIQHHQAHIASCIFDNNITGDVIGVAFDGTGFGLDGNLWGGDFFVGNAKNFKRIAHLSYIPLIGAEEAILEPNRIASSLLYMIYGDRFLRLKINFVKMIDKKRWQFLKNMLEKKINSPLSCSAGRLFDAVSSLLGLVRKKIAFEAEGPIKLEKLANEFRDTNLKSMYYNYSIDWQDDAYHIDTRRLIKEVVMDLERKAATRKIAFKFHNTLAKLILDVARKVRRETQIKRIALSGGVFQNKLLSSLTKQKLSKNGFDVFQHRIFSPSDESICLGQILIANAKKKK